MAKISKDELNQRRSLFEAFTGNRGAAVGGESTSVRSMLGTLYGTTRNGQAAIDTREAARRLGVSQRTVQRWIKNDHAPSASHLKDLQKRSRQAATTKRGRARALRRARRQQGPQKQGVKVSVNGTQGPKDYPREGRNSSQKLTPEEYENLLNAYAEGGDTAAMEYLTAVYSEQYVDNWQFNKVADFRISGLSDLDRDDPRAL
ncbi:helix-turn-helix domain-containing protein [Curtobacterium flaccumfaciens pv. oortii]|uniref:helix-turn-helix domain-containing protein n=1 Tax=Curtobacterium flaccumfaciens TaxID=2035 RepID=UPI002657BA80|nr:helix-turn-helix domain-containing protein [Curtobacterium flaccumfaciens]MCS5524752.1 helix-turn-helix domain-containing protein [Curtobacterium flaccumfaciens pv. oortii]